MRSRPLPPSGPVPLQTLVTAAVGLLLVANGAYLYPGGASGERVVVYEAHEVSDTDLGALAADVDGLRSCTTVAVESQDCAVVRYVLVNGPLRVETDADLGGGFTDYRFAVTSEGVFRPAPRVVNGTLVVALERVDPDTARADLAVEADDVAAPVRRAVVEGRANATASADLPETRLVERAGKYHLVERDRIVHREPSPSPTVLLAVRLAGWIGGLGLLYWAGRRSVGS